MHSSNFRFNWNGVGGGCGRKSGDLYFGTRLQTIFLIGKRLLHRRNSLRNPIAHHQNSVISYCTGIDLLSIFFAVSDVGRDEKCLSNLNLVLWLISLFAFVIFGSFLFAITTYGASFGDYFIKFF